MWWLLQSIALFLQLNVINMLQMLLLFKIYRTPGGTWTYNPLKRRQVPYPLGHKRSMKNSILTQQVGLKSEKSWFLCCRLSLGCYKALDKNVIVIVYSAYYYWKTKSKFSLLYVVRCIRLENTIVWFKIICIMIEL